MVEGKQSLTCFASLSYSSTEASTKLIDGQADKEQKPARQVEETKQRGKVRSSSANGASAASPAEFDAVLSTELQAERDAS